MTFFQALILINVLQIFVAVLCGLQNRKEKEEADKELEELKRNLEEGSDL